MLYKIKAYNAYGNEITGGLHGQSEYEDNGKSYAMCRQYKCLMREDNQRQWDDVAYWIVTEASTDRRLKLVANPFGYGNSFSESIRHALLTKTPHDAVIVIGANKLGEHVVLFNFEENQPASFKTDLIKPVGFFMNRPAVPYLTKQHMGWYALETNSLYSIQFVRAVANGLTLSASESQMPNQSKDLQVGFLMEDLPECMKKYVNAMCRVLQAQHATNKECAVLINILNSTLSEYDHVPANLIKHMQVLAKDKNTTPSDWYEMAEKLDQRVVLAIQAVEEDMSGKVHQILTGEIDAEKYAEAKNATAILTRAHIENSMEM